MNELEREIEDAEERGNNCWSSVFELARGMRSPTQVESLASVRRPRVYPQPQEEWWRIPACRPVFLFHGFCFLSENEAGSSSEREGGRKMERKRWKFEEREKGTNSSS